MRSRNFSTIVGLALIVTAFVVPLLGIPADERQPFKVTAEIISQRYCSSDGKTFTVIFKLRTKFENQTGHRLIVVRDIGAFIPHLAIANDAKNLSLGRYEWYTNEDWTFEPAHPEAPEPFKSPGSSFAILAPGESLQNDGEYQPGPVGSLPGIHPARGSIQPGDHVLEYLIWPWIFNAKGEEIHNRWESFGDLVYKTIKVGPLPFNLPADPKIEKCN
jgi:hypothetical protein